MGGTVPALPFNTLSRAAGKDERTQAWLARHASGAGAADLALLANCFHLVRRQLAQQDEPDPAQRRTFSIQNYTPVALQARLATFAQSFEVNAVLNQHHHNWAKMAGFPENPSLQQVFVLQAMVQADPHNLRSLPHLVRWLQADALPEDLPGMKDTLSHWERHRQGRPELTPLNRFPHLGDLRTALPKESFTIEQRLRFEAEAVSKDGATKLWEQGDSVLYHVTSEEGAQLLGSQRRGAEWCTGWGGRHDPKKTSIFGGYSKDLLYLRRGTAIYQIHFGTRQFKDADDEDYPLGNMLTGAPGLGTALAPAMARSMVEMAANGWPSFMAQLLTTAHGTGDAALIQKTNAAWEQQVDMGMRRAAKKGQTDNMAELLTAAHGTGDAALTQKTNAALEQWVDMGMREAAEQGRVHDMAELLTAAHGTGDAALKAATQASCKGIPDLGTRRSQSPELDQALKLYNPHPRRSAPALQQSAFC